MYRIRLACSGIPATAGAEAAVDITRDFKDHRPWHDNVQCSWDGIRLILEASNDVDKEGLALLDEFSDCLCAYVESFDGQISVLSITKT